MSGLPYFIVIAAACAGFFISQHIARKKQTEEPLVCPIGFDCDAVVRSAYSRIGGVPLEYVGMAYYAGVAVDYAFLYAVPSLLIPPALSFAVLAASGGAVLFSLYLTGVQLFALKQWCLWCLISAALCIVVFVGVWYIAGLS